MFRSVTLKSQRSKRSIVSCWIVIYDHPIKALAVAIFNTAILIENVMISVAMPASAHPLHGIVPPLNENLQQVRHPSSLPLYPLKARG